MPPHPTLHRADEAPQLRLQRLRLFQLDGGADPEISDDGGLDECGWSAMFLVVIALMDPRFAPQVVGVAQAINKKSGDDGAFTDQDEKVCSARIGGRLLPAASAPAFLRRALMLCSCPPQDFSSYLAFSGIVLHNAQLYETSQLENRRNQVGSRLRTRARRPLSTFGICVRAGAVGPRQPHLRGAAVPGGSTQEVCRNHPVLHAGPSMHSLHCRRRLYGQ